jgi:hypothetical protein
MKRLILPFFIVSTLLSCKRSETLTQNQQDEIISEVRQTLTNYYDDIKTSGLTAEFKYLDHSEDFFWVPPGYSVSISYDSVATILNNNAPLFKSVENSFDTLRITALTQEFATYSGRLKSTMTDTSGNVVTAYLVETGLLIKRTEGWKLLSGQTSMVTPK